MCETFKRIKLLVVKLQKEWSTDSCKNFFGQMIVSDARAFQSTLKMHIFALPSSDIKLRVTHIF